MGEGRDGGRAQRGAAGDRPHRARSSTPAAACSAELLTPFKLGVGGPIAGGDQYLSWIHIDDEVGILLWALDNEQVNGVAQRHLAQPGHQPRLLEGARPRPRPAGGVPVPGLVLDLKFGNEFGAVLRGGQRVVPRRALELGYEFRHPDLDEALEDLL